MERRGRENISYADFGGWRRPPIDGANALQSDEVSPTSPRLQSVPSPVDIDKRISLADALTEARRRFVNEKTGNKIVKAYEVEQDVVVYRVLATYRGSSEYKEAKEKVDSYTQIQVGTHLGERLHVGISKLSHDIIGNELRIAGTGESLLTMMKNGRDYRRKFGNPIDWDREEGEVVGGEFIQDELTDPNTPVGTMIFFVSSAGDIENGSIYHKYFYDVFHKVSETKAESTRYTSGLTPEESHQRLRIVDSRYDRDELPTDAEMLANPVVIKPGTKGLKSPDDVHDFMHVDHPHMSREKFAVVLMACQPLIDEYRESLTNDPENSTKHKKIFDMIMNHADNIADELASVPEGKIKALIQHPKDARPWLPKKIDRAALVVQIVRETYTGCGSSGGESAFSVAEAGGERSFTKDGKSKCPDCGKDATNNHYHCPEPKCKESYDDETNVSNRTKECRECGFKFSC